MFAISWSHSAKRDLTRLPEKIAVAAVEFIYGSLAENPRRVGRELQLDLAGHHSARRGDYRIIYAIDDTDGVVQILTNDHRADVYRPQGRRR